MNRVGKLNTTLFMNRVVEWELSFTEDFVVIPTIDLEIQLFVGLVMTPDESLRMHPITKVLRTLGDLANGNQRQEEI
ncbi:hypothetical protein [Leptospira interrogans]|uniref:hypothetical protein n=1 Tax=Leptospira interrogans TaxID=173 RepID=UPI0002BBF703|nr:hypothetical protein [Leptospira interrogans]KLO77709.1 Uncharacterized protein AAY48_1118 [Leptospira interrogans serovar Muenchen]UMQ59353.1 hypothetical protein FH585_06315 [Leptospira interrogans]UNE68269.1 hypothetical protein FH588_08635 [Leptospira interrogans]